MMGFLNIAGQRVPVPDRFIDLDPAEQQKIVDRAIEGLSLTTEGGIGKGGAPYMTQARVGAAATPADKLATLRGDFPEAQPYGDENFLFRSRDTGQPTLALEPGMSVGGLFQHAADIGEGVGATMGAVGAGIPGAAGGAILGREAIKAGLGPRVVDTRPTSNRLLDAATTGLFNAGLEGAGRIAGPMVSRAVRDVLGPAGTQPAQVARDVTAIGGTPTVSMVTGGNAARGLESWAAANPFGARTAQQTMQGNVEAVRRGVKQEVSALGGAGTPQEIGTDIKIHGAPAAERAFRVQQGSAYDHIYNNIGAGTPSPTGASNLQALRSQLQQEIADTPANQRALQPILDRVDEILGNPSNLTFGSLRSIRTETGKNMSEAARPGTALPLNARGYERIYGALSGDVNDIATAAGYGRELQAADRYTRQFARTGGPSDTLKTIGDLDPEQIYSWATSGTKQGATQLMRVKRLLPPEQWDTLRATVLDRLGKPRSSAVGRAPELAGPGGGDFSIESYLSGWDALAPEAKTVLFGSARSAPLRHALDRLVAGAQPIAAHVRQVSPTTGSQTALRTAVPLGLLATAGSIPGQLAAGSIGGAASAGLAVTAGTLAPYLTSKLMRNVAFVNWLAGARAAASRPGSLPSWIGRLTAIGAAEPAVKADVIKLRDAILGQGQQ
jgi:hypothetical protein